jgi:hypothetical protein
MTTKTAKVASTEELATDGQSPVEADNVTRFRASSSPDVSPDIMKEAATKAAAEENDPFNNLMAEAVKSPDDFGLGQPSLGAIPLRQPLNGEFLRCHKTFCPQFHLYPSPFTKRVFLVFSKFVPLIGKENTRLHTMRMFITPRFEAFMWAMKAGIVDSELSMTYARSRDAVVAATIKQWVACMATRGLWSTAAPLDPTIFPEDDKLIWPPGDHNKWLALAWRGNIIADKDHDEIQFRQGVKLP